MDETKWTKIPGIPAATMKTRDWNMMPVHFDVVIKHAEAEVKSYDVWVHRSERYESVKEYITRAQQLLRMSS